MLQDQQRLDESGEAGGRVEVADVRLGRAEGAVAGAVGVLAVGAGGAVELDRVALERAGAMGLQVADAVRADTGAPQGLADGRALAPGARGGERLLVGPVVADAPAADDPVDRVAVGDRPAQPLQYDGQDARSSDGAVGSGVEGPQAAGLGEDRALHVAVADDLRHVDGGGADEGDVAVTHEQGLCGGLHADQRTGAACLDVDRGAGQAQPVGDPGGGEVGVVADRDLHAGHPVGGGLAGQDVVEEVVLQGVEVISGAGVDADAAAVPFVRVAGVLQGVLGALQDHAVLGVGEPGLTGAHGEVLGVEAGDVVQHSGGADEVGRPVLLGGDTGGVQFLVREPGDAVRAVPDDTPELLGRVCAGQPEGHADDGHPRVEVAQGHQLRPSVTVGLS